MTNRPLAPLQARHYDWKLRAIKTTLYVAGGMKRAAPELTEDKARQPLSVCWPSCVIASGRRFRRSPCSLR